MTVENCPVYLEPQHSVLLNPRSIMEILTSINRPLRVREKMPCGCSTVLKVKTPWIKVRPYSHFPVGQLKENQSINYLFWKQWLACLFISISRSQTTRGERTVPTPPGKPWRSWAINLYHPGEGREISNPSFKYSKDRSDNVWVNTVISSCSPSQD